MVDQRVVLKTHHLILFFAVFLTLFQLVPVSWIPSRIECPDIHIGGSASFFFLDLPFQGSFGYVSTRFSVAMTHPASFFCKFLYSLVVSGHLDFENVIISCFGRCSGL